MRRFVGIAAALAACVSALALAPAVSASAPMAAAGGFSVDSFNSTFVKYAGGNLFFKEHDFATYTGTFAGTHVFDGTVEIFKDGSASFHGTVAFTGTVAGCGTGTVTLEVDGSADPSGMITRDHEQTLSNTGTLSVQASLDFGGVLPTLTYTGTYSC